MPTPHPVSRGRGGIRTHTACPTEPRRHLLHHILPVLFPLGDSRDTAWALVASWHTNA